MDDTSTVTVDNPTRDAIRPLRVNLLPGAVRASRIWRRAIRDAILLVAVAVLLVAGASVALLVWQGNLDRQAGVEMDRQARLLAEQREYADIAQVLADTRTIEAGLAELFADEASASELIGLVRQAFPEGSTLTGVSVAISGADEESSSAPGGAAAALNESDAVPIGQLEVRGTAAGQPQVREIEAALASTEGFEVPYLVSARALEGGGEAFTVRVAVTDVLVTGRFAAAADEGVAEGADE